MDALDIGTNFAGNPAGYMKFGRMSSWQLLL